MLTRSQASVHRVPRKTRGSHHSHSSAKPVRGRRSSRTPPAVGPDSRSTREPTRGAGASNPAGPCGRASKPLPPRGGGPARTETPGPGRTPPRPTAPSWEEGDTRRSLRASRHPGLERLAGGVCGAEALQTPGEPGPGWGRGRLTWGAAPGSEATHRPEMGCAGAAAAAASPARGFSPWPAGLRAPCRPCRAASLLRLPPSGSAVAALEFRRLLPPPFPPPPSPPPQAARLLHEPKHKHSGSSGETTSAGSAT